MNEPLGVMGTPQAGFFMTLLIGAIAGWIAERVTASDHGLFTNIIVGVAGSFLGWQLVQALGVSVGVGFLWNLLVASGGAVLRLVVWRAIAGRRG